MIKKIPHVLLLMICMLVIVHSMMPLKTVHAGTYNGADLAAAILVDPATLISSSYTDTDSSGTRQACVSTGLGIIQPTHGSSFVLLSTGIAGIYPVTSNGLNPGSERGNWFRGGQYGTPRDRATLTLTLQVPAFMHYLYYDVQFFTTEYPDYLNSQYNDQLTITVQSPSQGTTTYIINVNGGDFVLNANDILGSGFDVFATSGNPSDVDWLTTTPIPGAADAGATALTGREHPVSPNEQITVTFDIVDVGDNQFDSTAFIDNLHFTGFAQANLIARKTVVDLNGDEPEPGDILEYRITISNIGTAPQTNNPGYEFEDLIPQFTTYIPGSATKSSGTIAYSASQNKITWDGGIPAQSSVILTFRVQINQSLADGTIISNQGTVFWDSNEDGINDKTELSDDPNVDDGIDIDGDGDTGDDDPTIVIVSSFEVPVQLIENFANDPTGEKATQSYEDILWFETTTQSIQSAFSVAGDYHYHTPKSFKTKLRSSTGFEYWNYSLRALNCDVTAWEIWFACGNTSEPYDLYLEFKNTAGTTIAKIKILYSNEGTELPLEYLAKIYYLAPGNTWIQLNSKFTNGALYGGVLGDTWWYKLRIERTSNEQITYKLYQSNQGVVDDRTSGTLGTPFSDLSSIKWSTTADPIVCPIFFWDDHLLELQPRN
ncbi:MAG: choice-of-anchor L domain-containing protein [Candidatus Thermoplasmatota archaeon]